MTVEGDRAVSSKIMQIATSAVRFLWMAEGVTSVDDLTCLYTSLVSLLSRTTGDVSIDRPCRMVTTIFTLVGTLRSVSYTAAIGTGKW